MVIAHIVSVLKSKYWKRSLLWVFDQQESKATFGDATFSSCQKSQIEALCIKWRKLVQCYSERQYTHVRHLNHHDHLKFFALFCILSFSYISVFFSNSFLGRAWNLLVTVCTRIYGSLSKISNQPEIQTLMRNWPEPRVQSMNNREKHFFYL